MSKQQLEEAVVRVKAAGLSERITLLFCDYRHCQHLGPFDKVGLHSGATLSSLSAFCSSS